MISRKVSVRQDGPLDQAAGHLAEGPQGGGGDVVKNDEGRARAAGRRIPK